MLHRRWAGRTIREASVDVFLFDASRVGASRRRVNYILSYFLCVTALRTSSTILTVIGLIFINPDKELLENIMLFFNADRTILDAPQPLVTLALYGSFVAAINLMVFICAFRFYSHPFPIYGFGA